MAFDQGDAALTAPEGQRVDIVYSLAADRRGGGALELRVKDLAPTAQDQEPAT